MSLPSQDTTLSLPARLLLSIGPPSIILTTAYISPKTGILSPLAFVPTAYAYHRWREVKSTNRQRAGELEPMVWIYSLTATAGIAAVAAIQAGVGYGLATLLYGSGDARKTILREAMRSSTTGLAPEIVAQRAAIATSPRYITLYVATCFLAAGLGEEILKFLPVVYARWRGTPEERKPGDRAYLDYAMASSLAFGMVEGIGFFYSACEGKGESGARLVLTVVERLALGSTGHVLMAVLSALRATRREYYGDGRMSWWRVLAPSILIHGAFDAAALAFSAYEGNVGWIHPENPTTTAVMLAAAASMWCGTAWMVGRELKLLAGYDEKRKRE